MGKFGIWFALTGKNYSNGKAVSFCSYKHSHLSLNVHTSKIKNLCVPTLLLWFESQESFSTEKTKNCAKNTTLTCTHSCCFIREFPLCHSLWANSAKYMYKRKVNIMLPHRARRVIKFASTLPLNIYVVEPKTHQKWKLV